MMTGRNVVLTSVIVLVLAIASSVISLMRPLDNNGKGIDSYGVYPSGHRALVEVMQSLNLPASRTHSPFDARISHRACYVLVGPDIGLLEAEEGTLHEMENWVRDGGQLVISFVDGWPSPKFLDTFSLEGVQFTDFADDEPLYSSEDLDPENKTPIAFRKYLREQKKRAEEGGDPTIQDDFSEIITLTPPECVRYKIVERTGSLKYSSADVEELALREGDPVAIDTGETSPASVLKLAYGEEERTLIAEYTHGKGSVILVSDSSIFDNLSLLEGENSVLLVNMLSEERDLILFDEFYHGLSIRGNPIWIFAQPGYRIIALLLLATVALFIWRELPAFGIVHPPRKESRRSLVAYLDAVSRLLLKTRSQLVQLLVESENAFLWRMARSLRLAGERNQLNAIRTRLSRSNPELLNEFDEIIAEYKRYHQDGCSAKELLTLLNRSHRCLS